MFKKNPLPLCVPWLWWQQVPTETWTPVYQTAGSHFSDNHLNARHHENSKHHKHRFRHSVPRTQRMTAYERTCVSVSTGLASLLLPARARGKMKWGKHSACGTDRLLTVSKRTQHNLLRNFVFFYTTWKKVDHKNSNKKVIYSKDKRGY